MYHIHCKRQDTAPGGTNCSGLFSAGRGFTREVIRQGRLFAEIAIFPPCNDEYRCDATGNILL